MDETMLYNFKNLLNKSYWIFVQFAAYFTEYSVHESNHQNAFKNHLENRFVPRMNLRTSSIKLKNVGKITLKNSTTSTELEDFKSEYRAHKKEHQTLKNK